MAFVVISQNIHDKYTKAGEISWYKCLRGVGYIASVWWRQKCKTGLKLKFYLLNILYTMVLRLNCPTVLSSPWKHHFYYTYASTESFTKIAINIQYVVFEVYGRVSVWSSRYCTSTIYIITNTVLSHFWNRVTVEWLERRSIDPPSSLQVPSWLFCNTGKLVRLSLTAEGFSVAFLLCPIGGSVDVLHEIPVFFDEDEDGSLRRVETSFW